jgi:hypothetical protein
LGASREDENPRWWNSPGQTSHLSAVIVPFAPSTTCLSAHGGFSGACRAIGTRPDLVLEAVVDEANRVDPKLPGRSRRLDARCPNPLLTARQRRGQQTLWTLVDPCGRTRDRQAEADSFARRDASMVRWCVRSASSYDERILLGFPWTASMNARFCNS